MKKKIYLIFQVGIKFDLINHNFKPEFVDSGFNFVQDENNLYKSVVTGRIRIQLKK